MNLVQRVSDTIGKTKEVYQEVCLDGNFYSKIECKAIIKKNSEGFHHVSPTTYAGKIPKDTISIKFVWIMGALSFSRIYLF